MTEVARIENDLAQARQDLHQTLEQVNQKVGLVGTQFIRPENLLRVKPALTICLAGIAGLMVGAARKEGESFGAFAMGLVVGLALRGRQNEGESKRGKAQ